MESNEREVEESEFLSEAHLRRLEASDGIGRLELVSGIVILTSAIRRMQRKKKGEVP